MSEGDKPSDALIAQRIRNRVIEALELCLPEGQAQLEAEFPFVYVPYEVINFWEDWVRSPRPEHFTVPPFSADELEAVARFHGVWDAVAGELPEGHPSYALVKSQPYWSRLAAAAREALGVFERRGRLSDDELAD